VLVRGLKWSPGRYTIVHFWRYCSNGCSSWLRKPRLAAVSPPQRAASASSETSGLVRMNWFGFWGPPLCPMSADPHCSNGCRSTSAPGGPVKLSVVTRFLPIRGEQPPADTVVIIRAGVMATETLRRTAEDSFEDFGVYLVSVEAVLEGTIEEVCRASPRIGARYGQVRLSTAGRLRPAGFVLLATFDRPHYDVALPDLSDPVISRLDDCFDPAVPNPGKPSPGVP